MQRRRRRGRAAAAGRLAAVARGRGGQSARRAQRGEQLLHGRALVGVQLGAHAEVGEDGEELALAERALLLLLPPSPAAPWIRDVFRRKTRRSLAAWPSLSSAPLAAGRPSTVSVVSGARASASGTHSSVTRMFLRRWCDSYRQRGEVWSEERST